MEVMTLEQELPVDEFMTIPLAVLLEYWDPTIDDVWGCGAINPDDVLRQVNGLNNASYPTRLDSENFSSYEFNTARIAYLIHHGWDAPDVDAEPVTVDIGMRGYTPDELVPDGNHRLAAAKIRGDETITVCITGDIDKARKVFLEGMYIDEY
jgi:hypothetical protein